MSVDLSAESYLKEQFHIFGNIHFLADENISNALQWWNIHFKYFSTFIQALFFLVYYFIFLLYSIYLTTALCKLRFSTKHIIRS